MRLIFVRHGEPDYAHDCLTADGKRQAEAAASRLMREGITEIYSSPKGRALETAASTAEKLELPVHVLDYMAEITWSGEGIPFGGHPWKLSSMMVDEEDLDFRENDWRKHPYFKGNKATELYDVIAANIDKLLAGFGYRHEGSRFYCDGGSDKTIALFSHGGFGACALAHILSLPFPYVNTVMPYDYASVIILDFPIADKEYIHPRIALFNDCAHYQEKGRRPAIQQKSE